MQRAHLRIARCRRDALQRARQDQRQHAQLGFGRHGHQPGQHPLLHALRTAHHVPGVNEDGNILVRAMDEKVHHIRVVQVFVAHVVANLHAHATQLLGTRGFGASQLQVLQRHLRKHFEPVRVLGGKSQGLLVHLRSPICRTPGLPAIAKHHRRGTAHLDVHTLRIQFLHTKIRIPERTVNRAKGLIAQHDLPGIATLIQPQPRSTQGVYLLRLRTADGGKEMGVHIDHGGNPQMVVDMAKPAAGAWLAAGWRKDGVRGSRRRRTGLPAVARAQARLPTTGYTVVCGKLARSVRCQLW